ncbi:MAG: cation-transporting P-type ATPase [Chitinophagaceae bacterium]|nr:MAG: cation-transporting P-type ATPase [Chitinophagaceae bacterium]
MKMGLVVKQMKTVETLGSATVICTDKTGTLTENKMVLSELFFAGKIYHELEIGELNSIPLGRLLLDAMVLNNDAVMVAQDYYLGDSTEVALKMAVSRQGLNLPDGIRLAEIPFNSNRKMMTTFHKLSGKIIAFTKGAPEMLLPRCPLADQLGLKALVQAMTDKGQRTLAFAYRYYDHLPEHPNSITDEHDLVFLGVVGLKDPVREGVKQSVSECRNAGIVPVMITGDHLGTARSIALQTGIIQGEKELCITGEELGKMDEDLLLSKIQKVRVYARVSPDQKLRIVHALQKSGNFVAMTGDGINDAPSLVAANIGIAMGISGTDVAKAAADMILLDDNFVTIVRAVEAGRKVYDNILKLIKYLLTTNSSELLTLLLGPMIGLPLALLPIHILWLNLISDGLPALSLSFEKADENIMKRPPRDPQDQIFSMPRTFHMLWVGIMMAGVAISVQALAFVMHLHWQTIVFNVLCLSQMAHALSVRSESRTIFKLGFWSNPMMVLSVLVIILGQFMITFIPALQKIFHLEALNLQELIIVASASMSVLLVVELAKIFVKNRSSFSLSEDQ